MQQTINHNVRAYGSTNRKDKQENDEEDDEPNNNLKGKSDTDAPKQPPIEDVLYPTMKRRVCLKCKEETQKNEKEI